MKIPYLIMLLLSAQFSWAWNAAGHKLSALVTYDYLDEATRTTILDIVQHHPQYKKDFKPPLRIRFSNQETRNRWIFMQMSVWPDIARWYRGETRKQYHRSRWHYINKPIYLVSEEQYQDTLPTNLHMEPHGEPYYYNIAQSFAMMTKLLKDKDTPKEDKAIYLCWIFHQIGDIHQPLHSSALFEKDKFYKGDKGGNSVYLENAGKNLHSYWDGLMGHYSLKYKELIKEYERLYPTSTAEMYVNGIAQSNNTMKSWIDESHLLCKKLTYTPQIKAQVLKGELIGSSYVSVTLEDKMFLQYQQSSKKVADRRIFEAGYRMAAFLKEGLK